jgi:hypothetical protein
MKLLPKENWTIYRDWMIRELRDTMENDDRLKTHQRHSSLSSSNGSNVFASLFEVILYNKLLLNKKNIG